GSRGFSGGWRASSPRPCASSPRRAGERRRLATACSWSPTPTRPRDCRSRPTPSRSRWPVRRWTRPRWVKSGSRGPPAAPRGAAGWWGVGVLPGAVEGLEMDGRLAGAAACDEATRRRDLKTNPAALMALMWHHATGGKGQKDMVVLPYKDRLLLFSRYLQQLV